MLLVGQRIIGKRKHSQLFDINDEYFEDEEIDLAFSCPYGVKDNAINSIGICRNLRFLTEGDLEKNNDRAINLMVQMMEKIESIEADLGEVYGEYFMINFNIDEVNNKGLTKFIRDLGIILYINYYFIIHYFTFFLLIQE